MAIVNRTPGSSFYDKGATFSDVFFARDAVHRAADGADVIDVGGVSRPG